MTREMFWNSKYISRFAKYGLENQILVSIGRFGKTEADIYTKDRITQFFFTTSLGCLTFLVQLRSEI